TLTNAGVVTGGGGVGFDNAGGPGVSFQANDATFTNSGVVTGGVGFGKAGGAGVSFQANGATFTNSSMVTGGVGLGFPPSAGGPGVVGAGLTIVNSGVIAGGFSADGTTRASAIVFASGDNV